MHIDLITCSDPRENTPVDKLVEFMNEFPSVEIGVEASPSKIGPGTPRRAWFEKFFHAVRNNPTPLNLAMHLNDDYCECMCNGKIHNDMREWFNARRPDGGPVITRFQLNGIAYCEFSVVDLATLIFQNPDREFIVQYKCSYMSNWYGYLFGQSLDYEYVGGVRMFMLMRYCVPISVLIDRSKDRGIAPLEYNKPFGNYPPAMLRENIPGMPADAVYATGVKRSGYGGWLSPENADTAKQLDRMAAAAGDAHIWIDDRFNNPYSDMFDIELARAYVRAANDWNQRFGR